MTDILFGRGVQLPRESSNSTYMPFILITSVVFFCAASAGPYTVQFFHGTLKAGVQPTDATRPDVT